MRVLVVEDNALLRHHLKVQLQDLGHQVDDAEDAKEADYYLNEHLPDIAIVDLGLPDEDGLSLIRRWRSNDVSLPILVLTAQLGQLAVEVFPGLAEELIGGIAKAQHRKGGIGQFRRFFREQELMQRNGFFRWFAFSLSRGHHNQQLLIGYLFEFIVAGIDQSDIELRGNQIIAQGFRYTARITGLRGGDQRNPWHFCGRRWCCHIASWLLIQHAPKVTRNPRKLCGSEIGSGRLKARQLLRV